MQTSASQKLENTAQVTMVKGLQYLPQAIEWVKLVQQRFRHRLTLERARQMTVKEVLAEVGQQSAAQLPRWIRAFNGFCEAWRYCWPYCEEAAAFIPGAVCLSREKVDKLSQASMTMDSTLATTLPKAADEGYIVKLVLTWLVRVQNDIIEEASRLVREHNPDHLDGKKICAGYFFVERKRGLLCCVWSY